MSQLFQWNETFLTGLPSVDGQHQQLIGLINDLGELVVASEEIDPQAFAVARDRLLDYVAHHFGDEEAQMEQAGIDARHLEAHREAHRDFAADVLSQCESGEAISVAHANNLVEYLMRWLAYHILNTDQNMARQFRAIELGQSPAEAFEQEARNTEHGVDLFLEALKGLFRVVSARNHELRVLNRELEDRVKQRTHELEQANRQLQLLSTRDELTGLPNRRFAVLTLRQLCSETQRYGTPLAVLMLDADGFKEVNDRFGHAEGDALLQTLAVRLREAVRGSDVVCRLGGDEFLVICPHCTHEGANEVAKKILAARQPYFTADGVESWNGSLSIGVAEASPATARFEDLLDAADQAMYLAKREGGARVASRPGS